MWTFRGVNESRVWDVDNGLSTTGRGADVDLLLQSDRSVSRRHAEIRLARGRLSLKDLSSRYGTFLQRGGDEYAQLAPDVDVTLEDGDRVRFGLLQNEWTIAKLVATTCFSTTNLSRSDLAKTFEKLNVRILDEWTSECTHLTMPFITLTYKAVAALADRRPIVTPNYWKTHMRCVEDGLPLPDPADYLPSIKESTLDQQKANFNVVEERGCLFIGKQFVFLSKRQIAKYINIIKSAGGTAVLLSDCKMTKAQLCSSESVVIQFPVDEITQNSQVRMEKINDIIDRLEKSNLRVIPEAEIGLALLFVSLEKYCNPSFNFATKIINTESSNRQSDKMLLVLAPETQEERSSGVKIDSKEKKINETILTTSTHEPSPMSSSVDSIRTNRKLRRISVENEEPQKKILAVDNNLSLKESPFTRNKTFENNVRAVDDRIGEPSSISEEKNMAIINLKSGSRESKRYRKDSDAEDDGLFNFLPMNDKSQKTPKRNVSEDQCQNTDLKRIRLNDNPSTSTFKDSIIPNNSLCHTKHAISHMKTSLESTHWLTKNDPSHLVSLKKEKIENIDEKIPDYLENKFKEMDLQPAVVIINDSLIKKEANQSVSNSNLLQSGKNFKRFVKVLPLKRQSVIIPRNKLSIYEGVSTKTHKDIINSGYGVDDEDVHFELLKEQSKISKSHKSRRL